MQKGLFFGQRDLALFSRVSKQLVQGWMNVTVLFFKLNTDSIIVNVYGQAKKGIKQYYQAIQVVAMVDHNPQQVDFDQSYKYNNNTKFRFLMSTLKDKNVWPQIGDIILWKQMFWQITNKNQEQIIANDYDTQWSKSFETIILSPSKVQQLTNFTKQRYVR